MAVPQNVISALIALQPRTRLDIAKAIGMDRANLSAAMCGDRRFPANHLPKLLKLLRVSDEGLNPNVVHLWKLGSSVSDLNVALPFAFRDGADFGGLWRQGSGPYDFARTFDLPLLAITDGVVRIIVRSEVGAFAKPEPVNPVTVPTLRHRLGKPTGYARAMMQDIPARDFHRWESGKISITEFDAVIKPVDFA